MDLVAAFKLCSDPEAVYIEEMAAAEAALLEEKEDETTKEPDIIDET